MKTMVNPSVLILTFLCFSACNKELEQYDVGNLKCGAISTEVTPQMVEKNPAKYVGVCISWKGRISDIKEAEQGMVYTVDIPEKYKYCGKTSLDISVNPSGKLEGDRSFDGEWMPNYEHSLTLCEYLYSGELPNVNKEDYVSFTGQIIGNSKTPNPLFKDRSIERPFIAILSVTKIKP